MGDLGAAINDNNYSLSEEWRAVPGYEGLYEVSSLGRVRSVGRYIAYRHGLRWHEGQIRAVKTYNGYNYVNLCYSENKKYYEKRFLVHRLVAEAFIPNPEGKRCVDHLNTIKTDNRVENLRWVTHLENQRNPITAARLAEPAKTVIRLASDDSIKEYPMIKDVIADGFSMSRVCFCCTHHGYFHKGFIWAYKGEPLHTYRYYIEAKQEAISKSNTKRRKPLIASNDNETVEYSSQLDAVYDGHDARAIAKCIKTGRKHHGYYWRFK